MRFKVFLAAMVAVCLASSARADIVYSFGTDVSSGGSGVATTASYNANGTITVNLYLDETLTKGTTTGIIGPGGTDGLFAAGVAINVVSGNGTITSVKLNTNSASGTGTGPSGSPGFSASSGGLSGSSVAANGSNAAILDSIGFGGTPPKAVAISSTLNQIYLGSVTISAGSGTTTFSVTSFNNSSNSLASSAGDSTVTNPGGYLLDQDGTTSGNVNFAGDEDVNTTFTVNGSAAVPEPSSMALCGLTVSAMGFGAWRRRKARLAAEVDAGEPASCA